MLLTLLCTFVYGEVFAQSRTVTGKVTSKEDGTPIPGATVKVKGGTVGSQTDVEGKFKFEIPNDAKQLEVSFIGMATQFITIGTQNDFNIAMATDETDLNEVVVVGYSVQEKRQVTGAISTVKGDVIENLPVQSFDRALQGRAAGVQVQSANGVPGGAVSVRIRGVGSITAGNEPLYIVDGVQMNNSNNASFSSNNPLSFLNPNDIESIDIIKDAAAASIYGAQASNGVVLVTTKKGKAGNTKFTLNYTRGINEPQPTLKMLNSQQFLQARYEAVQNRFPTTAPNAVWANVLGSVRLDPTLLTPEQRATIPNYDWQKESFKTGVIDNYELGISGGNDKTTFYLSGSYNSQDAAVRNVDFQRFTMRLNVNHKVNSRLSIDNSINLSSSAQRGTFGGPNGGSFLGSPVFSSPLILPFNRIYNEDGSYFGTPASGGLAGILGQNVIMNSDYNIIKNTNNQVVGNMGATYKIMDGLFFKAFAGLDFRYFRGTNFSDPRTADGQGVNGRVREESGQNTNFITNYTLNYNKTFNKLHQVAAVAGVEYRSDIREDISLSGIGVPTFQFNTANSTATPEATGGLWTGYKRAGAFGKVDYAFNKKYFASITLRYDGSSRFGENNQYGIFPGVSAGWMISEEAFLKNIAAISQLKLRASYGQTGNDQIGNFDSRGLYGAPGLTYNGLAGIAPSALGNSALRWEKNSTIDLGLDYGFFAGRIFGSVGVFQKTTSDLLLDRPLPQTSGFSSITSNIGEVVNKGFEAEISTVNVNYKDFKWTTSFNITLLDNKVTKLNAADTVLPGNPRVRLNQPLGTNFTTRYAGVNPATGRAMWYDNTGNITYTPRTPTDQFVNGADLSTMFGGLTNTFSYKGLELSVFFQYDYGRTAFNGQNAFMSENGGRLFNSLLDIYERRWLKPGDVTDVPRPFDGNVEVRGASYTGGSRFLEDASYIRLKQLSLSYMLPTTLISKAKLSSVRVYGTALNLLTFTKWGGIDPEFVSLANPGGAANNNTGVVPQTRSYTLGIQIGF